MAADWPRYNEALMKRGEILLDLSQSWGKELEEKYGTTDLDEIMSKELEGTEKSGKVAGSLVTVDLLVLLVEVA